MKIMDEFKAFAMRGNVIDLAVWVVIWGAFWKIVSSLVADVITPVVWILIGWIDFKTLWYTVNNLKWETVTIAYGIFLQSLFDFLIIAFSIFMVVKLINKAQEKVIKKHKAEEKKEEIKKADDILLLEEIRDLLKWDKKEKIIKLPEIKEIKEVKEDKEVKKEVKNEVVKEIELKVAPKRIITKKAPAKKTVSKSKTTTTKKIVK